MLNFRTDCPLWHIIISPSESRQPETDSAAHSQALIRQVIYGWKPDVSYSVSSEFIGSLGKKRMKTEKCLWLIGLILVEIKPFKEIYDVLKNIQIKTIGFAIIAMPTNSYVQNVSEACFLLYFTF